MDIQLQVTGSFLAFGTPEMGAAGCQLDDA
jgi:hypothetical protein